MARLNLKDLYDFTKSPGKGGWIDENKIIEKNPVVKKQNLPMVFNENRQIAVPKTSNIKKVNPLSILGGLFSNLIFPDSLGEGSELPSLKPQIPSPKGANLISVLSKQNEILERLVSSVSSLSIITASNPGNPFGITNNNISKNKQIETTNVDLSNLEKELKDLKEILRDKKIDFKDITKSIENIKLDPKIEVSQNTPDIYVKPSDVKVEVNPHLKATLDIKNPVSIELPQNITQNQSEMLDLKKKTYEILKENDEFQKNPQDLIDIDGKKIGSKFSPRDIANIKNAMDARINSDENDFGRDDELDFLDNIDLSSLLQLKDLKTPSQIDKEFFNI